MKNVKGQIGQVQEKLNQLSQAVDAKGGDAADLPVDLSPVVSKLDSAITRVNGTTGVVHKDEHKDEDAEQRESTFKRD